MIKFIDTHYCNSMVASEELFALIKSMSKSEKRYFRMYASMHIMGEENSYMKLYDFISEQDKYDEPAVKKKFSREAFITYFPSVKNYLYRLILKSMRAFHSSDSVNTVLRNYLLDVEFLFNKNFYKSCSTILKKARKLAENHDKFDILLEIMRWQMRVFYHSKGYLRKQAQLEMNKYEEEFNDVLQKNSNLAEYEKASRILFSKYYREGQPRNKQDMLDLENMMNSPLYKNEKYALSYSAKMHFYDDNALYWNMSGNHQRAYTFCKKQLELIEARTEKSVELAHLYLLTLNNLVAQSTSLGYYNEISGLIEKMRAIPQTIPSADTKDFHANIFFYSYQCEMGAYIAAGKFEKALKLIGPIEAGISTYKEKIPFMFEYAFYYDMAYINFTLGNYRVALKHLNKVLNANKGELSRELSCAGRLLNLLLHFELNNEEVLPALLKSIYNFLGKGKKLYKTEIALIDFFSKKLPSASNKEAIKKFKALKEEIVQIIKDPYEAKILNYFDLVSWIESKIGNRNFSQMLKDKV